MQRTQRVRSSAETGVVHKRADRHGYTLSVGTGSSRVFHLLRHGTEFGVGYPAQVSALVAVAARATATRTAE